MPRQPRDKEPQADPKGGALMGPTHLFQHQGLERPRLEELLHKVGAAGGWDLGLAVCRLGLVMAKSQVLHNVPAGTAHMQGVRHAPS